MQKWKIRNSYTYVHLPFLTIFCLKLDDIFWKFCVHRIEVHRFHFQFTHALGFNIRAFFHLGLNLSGRCTFNSDWTIKTFFSGNLPLKGDGGKGAVKKSSEAMGIFTLGISTFRRLPERKVISCLRNTTKKFLLKAENFEIIRHILHFSRQFSLK